MQTTALLAIPDSRSVRQGFLSAMQYAGSPRRLPGLLCRRPIGAGGHGGEIVAEMRKSGRRNRKKTANLAGRGSTKESRLPITNILPVSSTEKINAVVLSGLLSISLKKPPDWISMTNAILRNCSRVRGATDAKPTPGNLHQRAKPGRGGEEGRKMGSARGT